MAGGLTLHDEAPARERGWLHHSVSYVTRAIYAVGDQGMFAGSSLAINLLLARWMGKVEYGGFAIAYTLFCVAVNLYSSIIVEPLYVLGASVYATALPAYLGRVLLLHGLFSMVIGVCLLAVAGLSGEHGVRVPAAILAAGCSFLFLPMLARATFYLRNQSASALKLSATYLGMNVLALIFLRGTGRLNAATAVLGIVAASAAAVVASGFAGHQGFKPALAFRQPEAVSFVRVLRDHIALAKWLTPNAILGLGINYVQTWQSAYFLGLEAVAGLRALVNIALPMSQSMNAGANVLLPALSRRWVYDRAGVHRRVLSCVGVGVIACTIYLGVAWRYYVPIEAVLFGGKYKEVAWLIPVLCSFPLLLVPVVVFSVALRAMRKPQAQMWTSLAQCVVGIVSAWILIPRFGMVGTAVSFGLAYGTGALGMALAYYLTRARALRVEPL